MDANVTAKYTLKVQSPKRLGHPTAMSRASTTKPRSIVLLLFLQKQNLANAIYLFGLGTLLSDPMPGMCTGRGLVAGIARAVGWFSGPTYDRRVTDDSVCGRSGRCAVSTLTKSQSVRTRHTRVAGVNASFETTGTGIVRRGGAGEGGRVSVVSR